MKRNDRLSLNLTTPFLMMGMTLCCQVALAGEPLQPNQIFTVKNESHYYLQPIVNYPNSRYNSDARLKEVVNQIKGEVLEGDLLDVSYNNIPFSSSFIAPARVPPNGRAQIVADVSDVRIIVGSLPPRDHEVNILYYARGTEAPDGFASFGSDGFLAITHPDTNDNLLYWDVNPCRLHFEYNRENISLKSLSLDDGYSTAPRNLIQCEKVDDHTIRITDYPAASG